MAANGRLAGVGGGRGQGIAFVPIHFNEMLREFNEHFDQLTAAYRVSSYGEQRAALRAIETDLHDRANAGLLSKVVHPTETFTTLLWSVLMPAVSRVGEFQEARTVNMDLVRVSLRLRLYFLEKGEFPERLDVLTDIPRDRFVDKPLIYRREGKGYVLYSVGPNGVDDGGLERSRARGREYDLVVRGR
jgi:hypothetical protein